MQVKAVLCAALYPNVAVMDDTAGKTVRPAWNDGNATVFIHPSSINHALDAHQFLRPYLMYLEKVGCWAQTCCSIHNQATCHCYARRSACPESWRWQSVSAH